jgi:hypothetical protein
MEDAKRANLTGKDNWTKYPRNMLFARALSNGQKWYAPDVFNGATVYTPDELGAVTDEDGNVIPGQFKDTDPIPPEHDAPAPIKQTTAAMTLEFAESVTSKDGKRYGELTIEELSYHHNGCVEGLKSTKISAEKREDLEMKRDASDVILKSRQATAA